MAHSLTPISSSASPLIPPPSINKTLLPISGFHLHRVQPCNGASAQTSRRTATLGLVGAILGVNFGGGRNANAAARRPPPPPPKEKKDPNMSAVQAKVLASRKRKEAMKDTVAKLREKGKSVTE